uniref:Uncharacterized protein n=1 Tax=Arundo donax TaxID=35708 RepID=A0A0A8ZWE2_ARUDO
MITWVSRSDPSLHVRLWMLLAKKSEVCVGAKGIKLCLK